MPTDAPKDEATGLGCAHDEGYELTGSGESRLGIDPEATPAGGARARRSQEIRHGDCDDAHDREYERSAAPVRDGSGKRSCRRGGPCIAWLGGVMTKAQEGMCGVTKAHTHPVAGTERSRCKLCAAPDRGAQREERAEDSERDVR
jgi:hypothetical protein